MLHILLAALILFLPSLVRAAAIEHASASVTSNVTTSSTTFVDVTGATLTSSSFTTGKKYLLLCTAQMGATSSDGTETQFVHGSTAFAGSGSWNPFGLTGVRNIYPCLEVWTAVASEGVAIQYRSRLGGANVASANFAHLFAMNLSDDLVENTDWFYNAVSADDAMSTSYENGASITVGAGDWLVIGNIQVDFGAQAVNTVAVRISDGTNVLPAADIDIGNSALDETVMGLSRVYTVASSATYTLQYAVSASTTANHLHSKIFAINLNKFRNHVSAYTEAGTNLSATDWATQIQTASLTPDVQGDVLIGASWSFDRNDSGNMANQRIQVDNSDSPAGQTTAVYDFRHGTDPLEDPMMQTTMVSNMTAAAHTIDLDGSVSATTGTPDAKTATLWAFTMELPAAASSSGSLMLMGVGR